MPQVRARPLLQWGPGCGRATGEFPWFWEELGWEAQRTGELVAPGQAGRWECMSSSLKASLDCRVTTAPHPALGAPGTALIVPAPSARADRWVVRVFNKIQTYISLFKWN